MADYSISTPLTTNTGLVYGVVGVSNTNTPILYDPNSIGSRTLTFTAPTGFSVVGSPLTGTGTISLGFSAGYSLPTTASQTKWDTAFGWGDHAAVGYLASGDIGSTVLAYDTNLQAFTTALTLPTVDGTAGQTLKTDGAGTVSFADVVTNGQIINGTAFFVTNTKPTTRIDGSALVAGDRWEKPSDGTSWFWNGTYWLSQEMLSLQINLAGGAVGHNAFPSAPSGVTTIFVESCTLAQQSANAGTNDASNYGVYSFLLREKLTTTEYLLASIQNYPLAINQANNWTASVNTALLIGNYSGALLRQGAGAGTDYAYGNYVPIIRYRWVF